MSIMSELDLIVQEFVAEHLDALDFDGILDLAYEQLLHQYREMELSELLALIKRDAPHLL